MRILFSKTPMTEIVCACNCGRVFKPKSLKEKYATAGCAYRAKIDGERRRIQNRKDRKAAA
jgi:hypothetical protein